MPFKQNFLRVAQVVVLIVSVLFASGCTLTGFALGESVDRHAADVTPTTFDPDSCDCKAGDQVVLTLQSGEMVEGKIRGISQRISITLFVLNSENSSYQFKDEVKIRWENIQSIETINKAGWGRVFLTTAGLIVDLVILALLTFNIGSAGN